MKNVEVISHSAICITTENGMKLYFDPFHIPEERADADLIFVTHPHYDHYSAEDIRRVMKPESVLVVPFSCKGILEKNPVPEEQAVYLKPWEETVLKGIPVTAVPAFNVGKQFHTRDKQWVGYLVQVDGLSYFVMGDTDGNEENQKVQCDVLLIPVGGKYTFNAAEAAEYAKLIKPNVEAIPTHYGDIVGKKEDAAEFLRLLKE